MDIRPIKTPADYEWALAEVERYFDNEPQPGTPEGDRFEVLADLIETYESRYWPIEAANPIDILREFMKTRNFDQGDLGKLLGSRSRASEVLNGQRHLSLEMIRRISSGWHIPADALVSPYPLQKKSAA